MNQTMFQPQHISKISTMRLRRSGYNVLTNYNFISRDKWYPAGWGFNKKVIGNVHRRLHYLAQHSPLPVQKRWTNVYKQFCVKHFGTVNASARYLDKYSCSAWL